MADIEINLESTDSKELLKSGHHAFVIKDYVNAAAALGKATQIMAQEHGDEHDSLGEVYLHYARALLELARDEAEPLGDAIPQGDEESDSDEQNGEETENGEDGGNEEEVENGEGKENGDEKGEMKENGDEKDEGVNAEDAEKDEEKKEEVVEKEEEQKEEKLTNGDGVLDGPSTSNGTTEEKTDEVENEEPSDLQLAWEVLEVAKKIFTARGDSGKELLSQTLILLGEVGMESENFADAVVDIKSGLELQESMYEKTNRKIAETQYKLGIAQSSVSSFDDSIKSFERTIETLNARIELLKRKEKDDEASKKEVEEMEELIPEIKEKINDMLSVKEERSKVVSELAEACSKIPVKKDEEQSSSSSTKEVKDISHLVKRKRKMDDETVENQPAKKPSP